MGKLLSKRLAVISIIIFAICGGTSCNPNATRHVQVNAAQAESEVAVKVKSRVETNPIAHAAMFAADAKLNLKASYEVGEPIRVGCTCAPVDGVKLTTEWTYSSGVQSLDFDGMTKDLWAKPGTNKVSVKLKMLKTHKLFVFVPVDPAKPPTQDNLKLQEIEVFDGYSESVLDGEFFQKGVVDPPPVAKVAVPNVVGMDYSAAYNALNAVGLDVNLNGPGTGIVEKQIPLAGTSVSIGSTVQVFVPSTPKPPDPPPSPQTSGPLRVMILEEADDRRDNKYPTAVREAYTSAAVYSYLGTHGAKPGFNTLVTWDDDYLAGQLVTAGYTTDVEQAYQEAKVASGANGASPKEPWLTIQQADSNGKWLTLYSGQITEANAANVLPTIQKFGGP